MLSDNEKSKEITISESQGDVIGVDVDGNGNIIGKNISVVINEFSEGHGLTLIHPNYFKENTDTEEDFQNWLKGYSFSLPSIYQKKEYRREKVISEIQRKLEEKKKVLLLGKSGTSKSTLLMEIICDYFNQGYKVLYNLGDVKLQNVNTIYDKLRGLVDANNKVLVVVDNVHNTKMTIIFHVIKQFQTLNQEKKNRLRFLLAANVPEFDWLLEKNVTDDEKLIQIIDTFLEGENDDDLRFNVPYFSEIESKGFVESYKQYLHSSRKVKSIEENAKEIYKYTNGYPIMVKFSCFQNGLLTHVKEMYHAHLLDRIDENSKEINKSKIQAFFVCSLFNISSLRLNTEILKKLGLDEVVLTLDNTLLVVSNDEWKTIHPRWDLELLYYMFNLKNKSDLQIIKDLFINSINAILNLPIDKFIILDTIYSTIGRGDFISIDIIEEMVGYEKIEDKLDENLKYEFLTFTLGRVYFYLNRHEKALAYYDKAIAIRPNDAAAYSNKAASSLLELKRYDESIRHFDKAIDINPHNATPYYGKGNALSKLGREPEAVECYSKALELNPLHYQSYYVLGKFFSNRGRYKEAIEYYNKAIELNPEDADIYYSKGLSLSLFGREKEAIECYDKSLEKNRQYPPSYNNKGLSLSKLGREKEAIECYDKAIEINPQYISAYLEKGNSFFDHGEYKEAIKCYDQVIEINPQYIDAYDNKGIALFKDGRNNEAIGAFDNAIKINPLYVSAYSHKAIVLSKLGRYGEARVYSFKARMLELYG